MRLHADAFTFYSMADTVRTRLAQEVMRVSWSSLAPHAKRGGLILVDETLDLVDVAVAVADDDTGSVRRWMEARQLNRPTVAETERWETENEERFSAIIVQPYVLATRDA